jgi:rRNA maturation endonuclease Nob1
MRLFNRKKSEDDSQLARCPRCSELVAEDATHACPSCGWDLRDAYQGPPIAVSGADGDAT